MTVGGAVKGQGFKRALIGAATLIAMLGAVIAVYCMQEITAQEYRTAAHDDEGRQHGHAARNCHAHDGRKGQQVGIQRNPADVVERECSCTHHLDNERCRKTSGPVGDAMADCVATVTVVALS